MKLLSLFLLLILSNPTGNHSQDLSFSNAETQECGQSISERLRDHFDRYEIRPDLVVNNNEDFGVVKSQTRTTMLADHRIVWITKANRKEVASSIRIDNETISLKDKVSFNNADGDHKIDLDLVNDWDQIRLYKLGDHEIIGITLISLNCTGLMCGVSAQVLYEVKTKSKTFFGSYRNDSEVKLFRYEQDDTPYFVAMNFDGDPHGVTTPTIVSYDLYKLESSGQFRTQKDTVGNKYFIKHTIFPVEEFKGADVLTKRELKTDELEQNWIRKVE